MTQVKERLELLRQAMKKAGISACIIPGTDPHAGEYISGDNTGRNSRFFHCLTQ